jgi:hypothetical protein
MLDRILAACGVRSGAAPGTCQCGAQAARALTPAETAAARLAAERRTRTLSRRVTDSRSEGECAEYNTIVFDEAAQAIVNSSAEIKRRDAFLESVAVVVEPLPARAGEYCVDATFTCSVVLGCYDSNGAAPTVVTGTVSFTRRKILYGGESTVRTYRSDGKVSGCMPIGFVQVSQPVLLRVDVRDDCDCADGTNRTVQATLGLFTITGLEREVMVTTPALGFGAPLCPANPCGDETDPVALFCRARFPAGEFR